MDGEESTTRHFAENQNLSASYLFTRNYATEVEQYNFENPDSLLLMFMYFETMLQYVRT